MRFTCQEQGLSKQTEREGDNLRKQEEREREREYRKKEKIKNTLSLVFYNSCPLPCHPSLSEKELSEVRGQGGDVKKKGEGRRTFCKIGNAIQVQTMQHPLI